MANPRVRRARKLFKLERLKQLLGLSKAEPEPEEVPGPVAEEAPEPVVEEAPEPVVEEAPEPVVEKAPEPGLTIQDPAPKKPRKSKVKK